ncbi:hypothetical protein D3C87_923500 [compost metagenome]
MIISLSGHWRQSQKFRMASALAYNNVTVYERPHASGEGFPPRGVGERREMRGEAGR